MTSKEIEHIDQVETRLTDAIGKLGIAIFAKIDLVASRELTCRNEMLQRLTRLETFGWVHSKAIWASVGIAGTLGAVWFKHYMGW